METTNKLQMTQLYQLLGEEGKAREILQSVQNVSFISLRSSH
jgi:hypothetical protein